MRVLSWGRWARSIQRGGIHSGKPSVLIWQVQPFCRKWVWWYRQTKVRLSRSVGPPRIQSTDVVSIAPAGWVGAAGEGASAVSGDQRHGLAAGGQPLGSA